MTDSPSNISPPSHDKLDELQPTFRRLDDSQGNPITNRTTFDRQIKITGNNIQANSGVIIMNFDDELGRARSDALGEFETALLPLSKYDCHEVRIVGDYDIGPSSLPRKFTAARDKPAITEVSSNGLPVSPGDTIPGPDVTVACDSLPNADSRLFNGETLLKTETANACGKVTFELSALEPGEYSITLKDSSDNESQAFKFVLGEAAVTPATLDKVTDLDGNEIPKNSTTSKTSLYVEGEGEKGQKVEIFNSTDSLGEADVDATTGRYKYEIGPLVPKAYNLTAVAKWPSGGTSDPYPFTVEATVVAPTETRIYDADGNVIPDGGDIAKNWLIARGNYLPDSKVQIKLNGVIQQKQEDTNAEGQWVFFFTPLTVGTIYKISALTPDGKAESNEWSVKAIPPV